MTTLTIQIPDKDRDLFEKLAERLNGKIIKAVEEHAQPNSVTKKGYRRCPIGKNQKDRKS